MKCNSCFTNNSKRANTISETYLFWIYIYKYHTKEISHFNFIHYSKNLLTVWRNICTTSTRVPWCGIWHYLEEMVALWMMGFGSSVGSHWAFAASAFCSSFSFWASSLHLAFFSMLRVIRLSFRLTACQEKVRVKW